MDVRMPNLNGIDATRAIAATLPSTRIVVFSAYGDPALREAALDAGASGFLVKGCDAADIISALAA